MTFWHREGRRIGAAVVLALLIGALYAGTLQWLIAEWWANDYYSHGPLVAAISAVLIWRRRASSSRGPASWSALGVAVGGLIIHLLGMFTRAPYISALSFPILLAGLIGFLAGAATLRRLAFPLAFLWLSVPLPFVELASFPLQVITAGASTRLAQWIGIPAEVQGAQVTLATCSLQVGAPCSGLRSIVALLTLVILFVYVIRGPWLSRGLLLVLAVPIAIVANIARVTALLVIANQWGREAGLRYFHDFSSPVLFIIAFLLLVGLSWVLQCREIRSDL